MKDKKPKEKASVSWWGLFKKLVGNVAVYGTFLLLIISLMTAIQYRDNPGDAYIFGYRPVFVKTGSMEPTISVNSLLLVRQIEYDEVEVGDIILYETGEKTITHRVIDITDEGIHTQGDNNNAADPYVLGPANVKGKVVYIANWASIPMNDICPEGFGEGIVWMGVVKWAGPPIVVILSLELLASRFRKIDEEEDDEEELAAERARLERKERKKQERLAKKLARKGGALPEALESEHSEELAEDEPECDEEMEETVDDEFSLGVFDEEDDLFDEDFLEDEDADELTQPKQPSAKAVPQLPDLDFDDEDDELDLDIEFIQDEPVKPLKQVKNSVESKSQRKPAAEAVKPAANKKTVDKKKVSEPAEKEKESTVKKSAPVRKKAKDETGNTVQKKKVSAPANKENSAKKPVQKAPVSKKAKAGPAEVQQKKAPAVKEAPELTDDFELISSVPQNMSQKRPARKKTVEKPSAKQKSMPEKSTESVSVKKQNAKKASGSSSSGSDKQVNKEGSSSPAAKAPARKNAPSKQKNGSAPEKELKAKSGPKKPMGPAKKVTKKQEDKFLDMDDIFFDLDDGFDF